jgi:hypothetical protein
VSCLCAACDRLPGTEAFTEEKAKRAVREQLLDPTTAQFRNVEERDGSICGEVNAKNKLGAYTGFTRFVVDTASYRPLLDPQFDVGDLVSARELCTEVSGNEYSSASTTMSTCNRVAELELEESRQQSFDGAWTQHCEGAARQIYRPPLPGAEPQNATSATTESSAEASGANDPSATADDSDQSDPAGLDDGNATNTSVNDADVADDV